MGSRLGHGDMKSEPPEVCLVLIPPQMRQGQAFGLAVWTLGCFLEEGKCSETGGSHLGTCPIPPAGSGMLPTMPALAGCVGLPIHDVELAFRQVCEADADGGQDLHVIGLHDVAQEPHPKLLVEREGRISWDVPWPHEMSQSSPQCGPHLSFPKLYSHPLTASTLASSAANSSPDMAEEAS